MKSLEIKKDIFWVGALDPNLRVFDIIMETEFGTTYNSYFVPYPIIEIDNDYLHLQKRVFKTDCIPFIY